MRPCGPAVARVRPDVRGRGAAVDSAGAPAEGVAADGVVLGEERAFCEELDDNLLFRWFLGMQLMERSFDATVFTKNRQRLLEHQVGQQLFDEVVLAADRRSLLSDEHFTVDGTLIEAAASLKSFKPRDGDPPPDDGDRGNPSVDFAGERSDGDGGAGCGPGAAGRGARMRSPCCLDECAFGFHGFHPRTLGGDKGYDTRGCVRAMRARGVTPHAAQHTSGRSSAIDGCTTRHRSYALSQRLRKRVEEIFGWMKTVGGFRRTRYRGLDRTGLAGYLVGTAYNLARMAGLLTSETPAPQATLAA